MRAKEVELEVHPTRLRLAVQGGVLLEGRLADAGAINVDSEFRPCQLARICFDFGEGVKDCSSVRVTVQNLLQQPAGRLGVVDVRLD